MIIGSEIELIKNTLNSEYRNGIIVATFLITIIPTIIALFITGIFTLINIITNIIIKLKRKPFTIYLLKLLLIFIITPIFILYFYYLAIILGAISFIINTIKFIKKGKT